MKQVININFHGRVVPIEVSAYEKLKVYTDSLSRHFGKEEGGEEIINDIESRIAELFQERLKDGATCITDDHVDAVIQSMGRPEEFDEGATVENAEAEDKASAGEQPKTSPFHQAKRLYRDENDKVLGGVCSGIANYFGIDVVIVRVIFVLLFLTGIGVLPYIILWIAVPSSATTQIGGVKKKFYRDPDDKIIGGVCSGIGHYFNINPWIPRTLFLIPFLTFVFIWSSWGAFDFPNFVQFTFSPGALLFYIILWMVMPEANTTTEKLEMKGEKVDLNSIKNSVITELKGVQGRAEKLAKDAQQFASEKGKQVGAETATAAKRGSRSLGDIILFVVKIFVYFILAIVVISLLIALFATGIAAIGLFPLKNLILEGTSQNLYAWGTLIFFIMVPVVGIITWIIRRLTKARRGSSIMRFAFSGLWILGWVCLTLMLTSLSREFRKYNAPAETDITLTQPAVNKLVVTSIAPGTTYLKNKSWLRLEPFGTRLDDTIMVRNIEVNIVRSPNDSFRVTMMKFASGRTYNKAESKAQMINFNAYQNDTAFVIDNGIPITAKEKFRNQRVFITVYVPVGKQIRVDRSAYSDEMIEIEVPSTEELEMEFEGVERGWQPDTDYIMKEDGLYHTDGTPARSWMESRKEKGNLKVDVNEQGLKIELEEGRYRYQPEAPASPVVPGDIRRMEDSLQKEKERIEQELQKVKSTAWKQTIPTYNPMLVLM